MGTSVGILLDFTLRLAEEHSEIQHLYGYFSSFVTRVFLCSYSRQSLGVWSYSARKAGWHVVVAVVPTSA